MADALDDIRDLVHAQPALRALVGANFASGKLEVERLGAYPRVVWVSDGGTVDETEYIGGHPQATPGAGTRNRQIRTDTMTVHWHVWGEDRESTRAAMHALVAACYAEAHGAVAFGRYQWVTQQDERGEQAIHGQKIILEGEFQLAINEGAETLTNISTQTHRGDFVDPQTGAITPGICQT